MGGSTMGCLAKVSLWTVVMLQLFVLTRGLNEGERGVCLTPITTSVLEYKSLKRCQKPYSTQCSTKEQKEQHTPFGYKCCKWKKPITIVKPICCNKWKWQKIDDVEKCLPICLQECKNGRCVEPDKCECDAPLVLVKNECVAPECSTPCFNGICVAENTCECIANHKPYNVTHCHKECDLGYTNDPVTLDCVPKCEKPCLNGICSAPNKCTCFDGYRFNETSSTCSPTCDECVHGTCIAPNDCECNEGYKKENGRCIPVCDPPCNNGICSAPNICECNAGYENDHKNKFDCLPTCYPNCVNASCVSPDMCSCLSGYKNTGSKWICEPKCEDCKYGDCISPGECICHHGYANKNGKCEPVCEDCEHGDCISPGKCICHHGYANKNGKCEPVCKDCGDGDCIAPEECICHHGYVNKNGKCEPVCEKPCINGICSEPNMCTCNSHFKAHSTDKFSCEPICETSCANATCTSPNTCTCLTGYEPTTNDHICKPKCESCVHGECVAPDSCECHTGYTMIDGKCNIVSVNCETCKSNCSSGDCYCDNGTPCISKKAEESTSMAGLELSGALGGAVVLLLVILIVAIMFRIYRKRKEIEEKTVDDAHVDRYGSVVYTVPDTLLHRKESDNDYSNDNDVKNCNDDDYSNNATNPTKTDSLLKPKFVHTNEII